MESAKIILEDGATNYILPEVAWAGRDGRNPGGNRLRKGLFDTEKGKILAREREKKKNTR